MPPRRSANKEKAAAVSEAMPQRVPKNIRKESPNVPDKGQVATVRATSRTTEPRRHKRVAVLVIFFVSIISLSLVLMGYPLFSLTPKRWSSKTSTWMMTATIPHLTLTTWLIVSSNQPSPCVHRTREIPKPQAVERLISHIFLLFMETTRRSGSGCADYVGESSSIMPTIALFVNVLARNMASTRFRKAWQTTSTVWGQDIRIFESTSPISTLLTTTRLSRRTTGSIAPQAILSPVHPTL